jgi:hypothetical protein
MNHSRNKTLTLSAEEAATLRASVRLRGEKATVEILGLDQRTVFRAAAEAPIGWLTANIIRGRLDRI